MLHVDFKGQVTGYAYDDFGRETGEYRWAVGQFTALQQSGPDYNVPTTGSTEETTYEYNAEGQQSEVDDFDSTSNQHWNTTYIYDPITAQVSSITSPDGTINYAYDPATGNHTETWTGTNHDSPTTDIVYGYDTQGRLTSVTQKAIDGTVNESSAPSTTYTYDFAGNLAIETLPDGVVTTYGYDQEERLTSLTSTYSGSVMFSRVFTLNPDGTRASVAEQELQTNGTTMATIDTTWTYDALDRLTGETVSSSLSGGTFTDTYSYDLDNNRIVKTHAVSGTTETTTSFYNGDEQLTKTIDSQSGTTTYTYDANGSQTSVTNGSNTTTYTYDLRNRLSSVTTGGATTTYTYDADGNRVSETSGGTTTYYLIDTDNPTGYPKPIEQKSSLTGAPTVTYILGNNVIGQANGSGAVTYLLTDGHGSTRQLLATSGGTVTVAATFNYDAYGNAIGFNANSAATAYLFGGDGMYDPASGLVFHGEGRQTDGDTGDFIEDDPEGYGSNQDPITLSGYIYAGSDPINNTDPSGHDFDFEFVAGFDAIFEAFDIDRWGTGTSSTTWHPFQNRPPLALTFIPVFGPLLNAAYDFTNGNYWGGAVDLGFASFDAFGGELIDWARASPPLLNGIIRGSDDLLKVRASPQTTTMVAGIFERNGFKVITNAAADGTDATVGGARINKANILHHIDIFSGWAEDARLLNFERDTCNKAVQVLNNLLTEIYPP